MGLAVGLPVPVVPWEVHVDRRRFFSDLAWLADGDDWTRRAITFEYDGEVKYGGDLEASSRVVVDEKVREDAIRSADIAVHRVSADRLRDSARAAAWLVSHFPPSVRRSLQPRPALDPPRW